MSSRDWPRERPATCRPLPTGPSAAAEAGRPERPSGPGQRRRQGPVGCPPGRVTPPQRRGQPPFRCSPRRVTPPQLGPRGRNAERDADRGQGVPDQGPGRLSHDAEPAGRSRRLARQSRGKSRTGSGRVMKLHSRQSSLGREGPGPEPRRRGGGRSPSSRRAAEPDLPPAKAEDPALGAGRQQELVAVVHAVHAEGLPRARRRRRARPLRRPPGCRRRSANRLPAAAPEPAPRPS